MTERSTALADPWARHRADLAIEIIETAILDIPITRRHGFARVSIDHLSYVLVRLRTRTGIVGIGEGATPGGPWWGGESVESMKAMIDSHLAPAVLGLDVAGVEQFRDRLASVVPGNHFAKAPLEMAAFDAWGKALGVSVAELLGGACRDRLPVTWALSAGGLAAVLEETRERLALGHRRFKLKMGALPRHEDLHRAEAVLAVLEGHAQLSVDPNGCWDEADARWFCRELAALGVESIEQPVPGWNHDALARLSRESAVPIMADESLVSVRDAVTLGSRAAATTFALKIQKSGGLLNTVAIARVAEATGRRCFGGSTLETSVGTAAGLAVYCTRPGLEQCELVGPLLLSDDVVAGGVSYCDGSVILPTGPGLGVTLDEEKVAAYTR